MLTPVGGSAPFLRYGAPTEAPNWYPSTGRLVPEPRVPNCLGSQRDEWDTETRSKSGSATELETFGFRSNTFGIELSQYASPFPWYTLYSNVYWGTTVRSHTLGAPPQRVRSSAPLGGTKGTSEALSFT
jgi:hypothetical protein